ncbi:MAG: LPS-assembly protein LptD, partial [Armatimonadetes bacterium]|nr:LPS-assembly protein LptD [Armatimonadota bacterium]
MRLVRQWSVVCLCGLLSARAGAQTLFPPTISPPTPPPAPAPPPLAPTLPQTGGDQAYLGEPTPNLDDAVYDADTAVSDENGQLRLLGHVTVKYQGYTLTSDRADIDPDRRSVLFSGNFVVTTPNGQRVEGGRYGTLDLHQRGSIYRVTGARTTIPPQDLPLGIIQPLYIYGGTITGRPGFVDARGSLFTTCDFPEPHYSFGAKQVYLVPGRHLVAKYVSYYRHGHRLFTIPYLYVPLDRRLERSEIIPQVGYDPTDGYFAKLALGYALASSLPGLLILNEYQKRGLETGFDQAYGDLGRLRQGAGTVEFTHLNDKSTGNQSLTYGLNHQQRIGTVLVALAAQGQDNSSYVSQTKTQAQNVQLNLTQHLGDFNTTIQNNLTRNDYGNGLSQTLTSTLDNIYQAGRSRLETRFNYSGITSPSFGFGGGSNQRRLDS